MSGGPRIPAHGTATGRRSRPRALDSLTSCRNLLPQAAAESCAAARAHRSTTAHRQGLQNPPWSRIGGSTMSDTLRDDALEYHRLPTPARSRSFRPRRWSPSATSRSRTRPAWPRPATRSCATRARRTHCTARGNLVAVVTNGTAVLGLGNIGPLAGKPVMEGKGCLFKKFAGIDVFDIEIDERDPDKLVDIIAALEPTFGGINLEDIKAPECFYIERKLRERHEDPGVPRRPARHGDHRAAPRSSTACKLRRQGHRQGQAGVLGRGRGGARLPRPAGEARHDAREHLVTDIKGVLHRPTAATWTRTRQRYARDTAARTLADAIAGRRHLPRAVGGGRAEARDGRDDGAASRSSWRWPIRRPRSCRRRRKRGAARRDHRHRALRLSEPGQQRPVLPVHLPRRARRRRHHDQRGDEARRRARASPSWRRPRSPTWWPRPTASTACASGPNT